ncbi:MAG: dimethylsulfonioproprionate lyase family protein [Pseudomonadota bacterium]
MEQITTPMTARLMDRPDWNYLLREYYEMYRFLSAGGSDRIRSHMRIVREAIGRVLKTNPMVLQRVPETLPVTTHLPRALDEGRERALSPVVRCLDRLKDELSWQHGYDRMPRSLMKSYAYAELAGPRGPIESHEVILGLVLFAPGCTYPAHSHSGITESYVCLSGAVSENHQGVYGPGSLIFNPPEHLHRITVSSTEPALLAYAWSGRREDLSHQKMVLTPRRR